MNECQGWINNRELKDLTELIKNSHRTMQFQGIPDELPAPWHWDDTDLTQQLYREMPERHVLFSESLKTVARRQDNDDVLFQLGKDDFRYAVVHLTWSQKRLRDHDYPSTKLYKDWEDVYINRILVDSTGFE